MKQIKVMIWWDGNSQDITSLIQNVTWSGDYQQCVRFLIFRVAISPTDGNLPPVHCELGNQVQFFEEGKLLFDGYAVARQKATDSSTLEVTCWDRGFYLKQNQGVYKFQNQMPDAITRRICTDFGIKVGALAAPGVAVSRNFLGNTLYEMMQTAYTLASQETGEKYLLYFEGDSLCARADAFSPESPLLTGGSNLMNASTSESIENMVNQVAIYDKNDKLIRNVRHEQNILDFGLLQSYLKQDDKEDMSKKAQRILEDNDVSQKISVNSLGDTACITGQSVVVQEPFTGLNGLFWIERDEHAWESGQYYNQLTLNFKRMMDEKEAGSAPQS